MVSVGAAIDFATLELGAAKRGVGVTTHDICSRQLDLRDRLRGGLGGLAGRAPSLRTACSNWPTPGQRRDGSGRGGRIGRRPCHLLAATEAAPDALMCKPRRCEPRPPRGAAAALGHQQWRLKAKAFSNG